MVRLLVGAAMAIALFLLLAWWNSAVAVLFGVAVIAWFLSSLYWRYAGTDPHIRK